MKTDIWISGQRADMYSDSKMRYTFQVNDISEVKDRQASYTNSFPIPKTAHNIRLFSGLGIASDTSRIPYQKPTLQINIDGFDLINKGWLNVTESAKDYKINVYSGIINFFKSIENKTLGDDLDLSEINHIKNLASVISSFSNPFYKYLITDYNGLTHYGTSGEKINIDYLVPSVKVSYLWNKLHEAEGYTFSGGTFASDDFLNLYITYPKSLSLDTLDLMVEGTGVLYVDYYSANGPNAHYRQMIISNFDLSRSFTALEAANYKISIEINDTFASNLNATVKYFMSINEDNINYSERINSVLLGEFPAVAGTTTHIIERVIFLNAGDQITFYNYLLMNGYLRWGSEFSVKIEKFNVADVSFNEELREFGMTEFVKEIMNQFGLTPFPDEFSKNIRYLTLAERINEATVKDWSDKYIERTEERYVYETYAQQNVFSYNYNDKESTYHNGYLSINNLNITDRKDVWKSKMYSPEKELTDFYLGTFGNKYLRIFKLYEKEIKDVDGVTEIKYKNLEKRFHFVRSQTIATTATIGSKAYNEEQTVTTLPLASFSKLDWTSLLRKNYNEFGRILNDSRIHPIILNLNLADLLHLDLSNIFYFKQEQQYYILNKLNFDDNKQEGDFIRVKRYIDEAIIIDPEDPEEYILRIVWGDGSNSPKIGANTTQTIQISALSYPADDELVSFDWERFDGTTWISLGTGISPYSTSISIGIQKFRMKATSESLNEYFSNELQYERFAINCRNYRATLVANSGDELTAVFMNCQGEQDSMTAYSTGFNQVLELNFCANEGSVNLNRGDLTYIGPCG